MTQRPTENFLTSFNCNPPVSDSAIDAFELESNLRLPGDYVDFLKVGNGGEGFIGGSYLILWKLEEIPQLNIAYEANEYAHGLILIGSDAAGEAYAFDTTVSPWPVVRIPFVGMDREFIVVLAQNFVSFLEFLFQMSRALQKMGSSPYAAKEIFEIKPVILGGSPTDPANKVILTREGHIEAVKYWNKLIKNLRKRRE
jgi:hypothetical protein